MKNLIKLEELVMFLLSIYLFNFLDYAWWVYLALILAPDIGMLGYLINTSIGATTYNLFHHKGIAIIIGFAGFWWSLPEMQLAGIILFGHSSMDRIFGYGLKFSDNFKHTHLGNL
ncbi:DUF4260 domain-containing protein [Ekhidna sp. MALMAid0563]|uniref:DUF4260 domain-containing protein n=1 Tax=Ekhidna sp. MALMAid0563 TaxID=3143937 RepID=UPI0032DE44DA